MISGRRLLRWTLLSVGGLIAFGILSLFLLALADFEMAGNGSADARSRAAWVLDRGDHLHYAVHILQARVFDICPCTRRAAATQYFEAHFHALTPWQRAVAADTHPRTASEWAAYVIGPFMVGIEWAHDGVSWLAGNHPTQQAVVAMDSYQFDRAEIHIPRGTTVTWRNVDDFAEAHTVTADPNQADWFDSGLLVPDETFSHTFTERGRYAYYCRQHGAPGGVQMAGVVIVE
jgi:plastocyanin